MCLVERLCVLFRHCLTGDDFQFADRCKTGLTLAYVTCFALHCRQVCTYHEDCCICIMAALAGVMDGALSV